jgi:hypothetical protein
MYCTCELGIVCTLTCGLYYIVDFEHIYIHTKLVVHTEKTKKVASPSATAQALGEELFKIKLPEFLPRVLHSGKRIFQKKNGGRHR